jgi:hypothetical protein
MNIIQREFDLVFYDSTHLRKNIIRVCRDHFALTNDLNNASINVSDLINSLHTSITNYEVVQKSAQFETYLQSNSNSFNQNQDDQYFTERQYRREEYSNRRDEFRDEDRSNDKLESLDSRKNALYAASTTADQSITSKRSEMTRKSVLLIVILNTKLVQNTIVA